MKFIQDYFYNRCLPRILEDGRRCDYGDRGIPRSGEEGKNINCYSIALYTEEEKPYLLLEGMDGGAGEVRAKEWNGRKFEIDKTVTLEHIREYTIKIRHYYGLGDVTYTGGEDYVYGKVFMLPYMQIHAAVIRYAVKNFLFMQKALTAKNRWGILKLMLKEQQKRGHGIGFDYTDALSLAHSHRWILHPNADEARNTMLLHLDSFVDSGELAYDGRKYVVQGRAVATIENREKERKRSVRNFLLAAIPSFIAGATLVVGVITNDKANEFIKGLF
ncbi:MAG: hypothetical protein OCC46_09555 [Pseudodesulfovibrio sp.]